MVRVVTSTLLAAAIAFFVADAQQPADTGNRPAPKGSVQGRLTWFDRHGKITGTTGPPGLYRTLTISPDGKRVAFERNDPQTQNRDLWLLDIATGATTRFTSDPGWDAFPTWSADSRRIVFTSNRGGNWDLYIKPADGSSDETLLFKSAESKGPTSWSPDGRWMIYYSLGQPTHIKALAFSGPTDRAPIPVTDPRFSSIQGRFSPDGRWIAYVSNESGASEVSVRPFDPQSGAIGQRVIVTTGGGRAPLWRADGEELFYIASDGMATAVEIDSNEGFHSGTPKPLFKVPSSVLFWDATPDGQRFLMPVAE